MKIGLLFELIRSDIELKRLWFLKNDSKFNRNVRVYLEPGTLAVIVYRIGHWVRLIKPAVIRIPLLIPYVLAKAVIVIAFSIYIPSQFKVGRGFVIHNYSGIFIPRTEAGDNFIVFQGVTIGHLRGQTNKPPRFGNNTFIGVSATLLGDIQIGNDVVIGANSLVMNDVPDNCTVIGVPARVVSRETNWMQEKLEGDGDHW